MGTCFPTFLFYLVSKKRVIQEKLQRSIHNSNIMVNDNFRAEESKDFKHLPDREGSKSLVLEGCELIISYTFSMQFRWRSLRFAFSYLSVRYIRTFETRRNREYAIINYARNQIAAATSLPYRRHHRRPHDGDNEKSGAYPTSENYLFSRKTSLEHFFNLTFLERKILLNMEKTIEALHFKNWPYSAFPKNTFIVWNFGWKILLNLYFLERSHYNAYRGKRSVALRKMIEVIEYLL